MLLGRVPGLVGAGGLTFIAVIGTTVAVEAVEVVATPNPLTEYASVVVDQIAAPPVCLNSLICLLLLCCRAPNRVGAGSDGTPVRPRAGEG